jgi:queuosine precursor transporter
MNQQLKTNLLLTTFLATILIVNLTGAKTTTFLGQTFSVSLIVFPLISLIQDVISEVFGRSKAREFLFLGIFANIIVSLFLLAATSFPPSARYLVDNAAYNTIFGQSLRIIFASITAFAISEFTDIFVFFKLKEFTEGKFLWLRADISTIIASTLDSFLFMFLAFYMISPKYTAEFVIQITLPYLGLKLLWTLINTPLIYAGVKWLKQEEIEQVEKI